MKKSYWIILLIFANSTGSANTVLFNNLPSTQISNLLNWIKAPKHEGLCEGYYLEAPDLKAYPNPPPIKDTETKITAKDEVIYAEHGDTTLTGEVTITQPGRKLIADKVILHRDPKTDKMISADLYGHVNYMEFGRLVIGNYSHLDFTNNTITMDNAIYHLGSAATLSKDAYGKMTHFVRDKNQVLTFHNVTYSTCQPEKSTWHIYGKKLVIDKANNLGTITGAILNIYNIPTLYFPYFRFPIEKVRKTGFLFPSYQYSEESGFGLNLPFYLNLAPNYDATITPEILLKRGILWDGLFRFLTPASNGQVEAKYIYHDKAFSNLQDSAIYDYPSNPSLDRLEDSSINRGEISLQNFSQINNNWSSKLDINYVTDDYFLRDFGLLPSTIADDQLFNQLQVNYTNDNWHFLGRVQAFQTLHLVNSTAYDQYSRLPQLNLNGYFPDRAFGLTYRLNTEFVYFDHRHTSFYDPNILIPIGQRYNLQPSVELPLNWNSMYLIPKIQLPVTYYNLNNLPFDQYHLEDNDHITRAIPMFDIDTGLALRRNFNLWHDSYTQTLEPRIFYLYVPEHGQYDIPDFDTNLSNLDINSLFRTNRFNSIDRIGDANQFAVALTSRILDNKYGVEQIRLSVGQIFALQKHKICLYDDPNSCIQDPLTQHNFSPTYGELRYYFNQNWHVTSDAAWDFNENNLNTASVNFQYIDPASRIINFGYNYVINGDSFDGNLVDLNRINISAAIPINKNWTILGNWNYNLSYHSAQNYLYGVEYNSCCFAIRLIGSRVYSGYEKFDNKFYVQLLLKGLGNVGYNNPGELLTTNISGFTDDFVYNVK